VLETIASCQGVEPGKSGEAAPEITQTITRRSGMRSYSIFKVIVPTEATAGWFGRWLFAPNPVPAHFGRKRRARRARGRRIEARQALGHGHWFRVPLDPSRPSLLEMGAARGHVIAKTSIFSVNHSLSEPWANPSLGEPWEGADS
jgi:hypothetical protein